MNVMTSTPAPAGGRQRLGRRPAATVAVTPVTRQELDLLLNWTDDSNSVIALARLLDLDTPDLMACPSRLGIFKQALANSPALRGAIKAGDPEQILPAWSEYSRLQAADPRHWHAMMMLMRERMIAQPQTWTPERTAELTALWLTVFGSTAFWSGLDRNTAETFSISPEEQRELFEWAVGEWLEGLKTSVSTAMTRHHQAGMTSALDALKLAEKDESKLREYLALRGLWVDLPADPRRYEFARDTAGHKLQELEDLAVQEAEALLENDQEKPPDHAAAIKSLGRFVAAGGRTSRVLILLLQWHLQPASANLHGEGQPVRIDPAAKTIVEQLEAEAVDGDSLRTENVLLGNYHLVEAYRHKEQRAWDPCHASAEAALRWNPRLFLAQFFYAVARINLLPQNRNNLSNLLEDGKERGFDQSLLAQIEKRLNEQ